MEISLIPVQVYKPLTKLIFTIAKWQNKVYSSYKLMSGDKVAAIYCGYELVGICLCLSECVCVCVTGIQGSSILFKCSVIVM